jgi:CubicO group peptidase (beta-lactamase class C family)
MLGIPAVALSRDGSVTFEQSWGTTNIHVPYSPLITLSTRMYIASVTKTVTASATLQLLEQGELSLDDPVEKYLLGLKIAQALEGFTDAGEPICRAPKRKLTLRNLMTRVWFELRIPH